MKFVPMDPDTIRELLKDHQDVITPAIKARQALLDAVPCPSCKRQGADLSLPKVKFEPDGKLSSLPFDDRHPDIHGYAKCRNCNTIFEPMTGIIITSSLPE